MSEVREFNRRVAEFYDTYTWEQAYPVALDPCALQHCARLFGGGDRLVDVLDLGCGTGRLLREASSLSTGRLVGTDISAKSCALASKALLPNGDRAEIINADFLDLNAERLGQFDLIYCIGVVFAVPPKVQEHLFELIGRCLRPGGIAVLSYYCGLGAAVRAHLAKTVRAANREKRPEMIASAGRAIVEILRRSMRRPSPHTLALRAAFNHFDKSADDRFVAEGLNGQAQAISTAELNVTMQRHGVQFARYLGYSEFDPTSSAADRAFVADIYDLAESGYRFALFVKTEHGAEPSSCSGAKTVSFNLPVPYSHGSPSMRWRMRRVARHLFWRIFGI